MHNYIKSLLIGSLILIWPDNMLADMRRIEERLAADGSIVAQWMILVNGAELKLVPASLTKEPNGVMVWTEIDRSTKDYLVGALLKYADGRITSSPLRSIDEGSLPRESANLAQLKVRELKESIQQNNSQLKKLEEEVSGLTLKLRRESGLAEVDAIYAKIAELDAKIAELDR